MDQVKEKVKNQVERYKELFPEEYKTVVAYLKEKRKNLFTKFGELKKGSSEILERGMFEIPETLDTMLNINMTVEQNQYRKTKEFAYWFMKEYREFLIPEKL